MKLLRPLLVIRNTWRRNDGCCVSTWSPLATAFNTRPNVFSRFSAFTNSSGLFNKPELVTGAGFNILKDQAIEATNRLVEEATSGLADRPMVEIFDELSDTLCKVADLAEFIRIAHPDPTFAQSAEDVCIRISGLVEQLNTNKDLYHALKRSVETNTSGDNHLAQLFLFDFEQSGIGLQEHTRSRIVAYTDLILQTGQKFMAGAAKPRKVPKHVIPKNARQFFATQGDMYSVSGVYAECSEVVAREAAYKLYLAPDPEQDKLLTTLLEARREMAGICGFESYSERAIRGSTMETSSNVQMFLDSLTVQLWDKAEADFETMRLMKMRESPVQAQLMCWDTPYYTHQARKILNVENSDFSPYFSLGGCMEGLNMICQELYGITLEPEEILPGEAWSPDVYKLAVIHESEGLLGHIYCDLYERAGKPRQDCHFTVHAGKQMPDGTYQNPIVVIMLSLSGAHRGGPALLSAASVDNLFHEFGHALHSMLGRAKYQHVSGTRCHTDLAEVPSVLMEYFASCPSVMKRYARHFQTGEPMPDDMIHRLCAAKFLFGASEMQLQVFYSALDHNYHGPNASFGGRTTEVLKEVQKKYYGLPYVEKTAWQHRFSHLVGYGAKYYSYLISRGVAWSVWRSFFADEPLSRTGGDGFRHGVLRHGGERPPKELLTEYLGTEITPEFIANALAEELDYHKDCLETVMKQIV